MKLPRLICLKTAQRLITLNRVMVFAPLNRFVIVIVILLYCEECAALFRFVVLRNRSTAAVIPSHERLGFGKTGDEAALWVPDMLGI